MKNTGNPLMAKNRQQKNKERERRVAQKKLAVATRRRAQVKADKESEKTASKTKKMMASAAVPKADYVPGSKTSPFTLRHSVD